MPQGSAEKLAQLKRWVKEEGSLTMPLSSLQSLLAEKIDLPTLLSLGVFKMETRDGDDVLRFDHPRVDPILLESFDQATKAVVACFKSFGRYLRPWERTTLPSWKNYFLPKKDGPEAGAQVEVQELQVEAQESSSGRRLRDLWTLTRFTRPPYIR